MPSAHPEKAYSQLERSLNDAPLLRAHKALPRSRDEARDSLPGAFPVQADYADDDDDASTQFSTGDSTPIASPLASPPLVNGHENGLPPTPPSVLHDGAQQHDSAAPQYADVVMSSLLSNKPSARTPVNQRSPPTPDPSPPRTAEHLTMPKSLPPPTLRYPSSRAESFTTAKSHLESDDDQSLFSFHDPPTPVQQMDVGAREQRSGQNGLDLEFERDGGDVTPTEHNPSGEQGRRASPALDATWKTRNGDLGRVSNDVMRNVTVRHRRPPKTPPQQTLSEEPEDEPSPLSVMKRGHSLRERAEDSKRLPRSPASEKVTRDIGCSHELEDNDNPRGSDSKRFSTASSTSAIVAAMVVTPPERRRKLRHAGQNLALRHSSDTTFERPSPVRSNRTSLNSDEMPLHRLVHQRARIPERRNRDSICSDFSSNFSASASPTESKQHQHESIPVLVIPEPLDDSPESAETPSRGHVRFNSLTDTTQSPSRVSAASNGNSGHPSALRHTQRRTSNETPSPASSRRQEEQPGSRQTGARNFTAPAVINGNNEKMTVSYSPKERPNDSFRRNPVDDPELHRNRSLPSISDPEKRDVVSPPLASTEVRRMLQERPTGTLQPRQSSGASSRTEEVSRPSLDASRTGERSRQNSESPTMQHGRISFAHSLARSHHTQTPYSQLSDTGDPLEVSEATAVTIYPHNNHSLVVVQQPARPNSTTLSSSRRCTVSTLPPPLFPPLSRQQDLSPPTMTLSPGTPSQQMIAVAEVEGFDSPLQNPRTPPEPPAVKIIPPTPAEELERDPLNGSIHEYDNLGNNVPPQPRPSLMQRARRYSDTLLHPLLLRTASVTRRANLSLGQNRTPRRAPSVSDQQTENNLHPFWRPRGFWDDFDSETDSDEDLIIPGEFEVTTADRLPQGGDTSDIGFEDEEDQYRDQEREQQKRKIGTLGRRLTNGFKGSGGFLIGNSLGMERAGSNARRHHVNVGLKRGFSRPLGLRARRFGGGGRVAKQASNRSLHSGGPGTTPLVSNRTSRFSAASSTDTEPPYDAREEPQYHRLPSRSSSPSPPRPPVRQEQLQRQRSGRRRRREFNVPGTKGEWSVEYVGLRGMRDRIQERRAEKRREALRSRIGEKFYLESSAAGV